MVIGTVGGQKKTGENQGFSLWVRGNSVLFLNQCIFIIQEPFEVYAHHTDTHRHTHTHTHTHRRKRFTVSYVKPRKCRSMLAVLDVK